MMNFSPLVDISATLASAIFAACAPVAVLKLNGLFKLNLDQTHRTAIATALDNALGLGLKVAQEAGDADLGSVNTRSAALATMVGYVKETVPSAVAHFGLTDDGLAQKAAARLAAFLHVPAAAPAVTPPAAIPAAPAAPIPAAS
jgi:hypothetical protein